MSTDVIIIGAGVAGLSCGRELLKSHHVTILEARDRIGGRVHSINFAGTTPIDLGASWVYQPEHHPLLQESLLRSTNVSDLVTSMADATNTFLDCAHVMEVYSEDGKKRFSDDAIRSGTQLFNAALRNRTLTDRTQYDVLHRTRQQIMNLQGRTEDADDTLQIFNWNIGRMEGWTGAPIEETSALEPADVLDTHTESTDGVPTKSYGPLLEQYAQPLIDRIVKNMVVAEIEYVRGEDEGRKCMVVKTVCGKQFLADYVVCTVPLGVLQANTITFTPSLPSSVTEKLNRLGMGLLNKVFMKFEKKFWTRPLLAVAPGDPVELYIEVAGNEPILWAMIGGTRAREFDKLSLDEALRIVLTPLRKVFGDALPNVVSAHKTSWLSDPYARGSYSYLGPNALPTDRKDIVETKVHGGRLIFGGEGVSELPSCVDGAALSGFNAAKQIIER
eukprot:PhF_6_TR34217/c0_g1_i4/m.50181